MTNAVKHVSHSTQYYGEYYNTHTQTQIDMDIFDEILIKLTHKPEVEINDRPTQTDKEWCTMATNTNEYKNVGTDPDN